MEIILAQIGEYIGILIRIVGVLIGDCIIALILGAIQCLITAFLLQVAAQCVVKKDISFRKAYATELTIWIHTALVAFVVVVVLLIVFAAGARAQLIQIITVESVLGNVIKFIRIGMFREAITVASVLMVPVGFLIRLRTMSSRLNVTLGKAFRIILAMLVIYISVAVVVGIFVLIIYNLCK